MKKIFLFLPLGILFFCACGTQTTAEPTAKLKAGESVNSEAFNTQFKNLLTQYYLLKDALVIEDSVAVTVAAGAVKQAADSLSLKEVKADATAMQTATQTIATIVSGCKTLSSSKDLATQRQYFQLLTNDVFSLIRTVHYDVEKVYFQHCPMAFDNKGGDWLSKDTAIVNPYLPKEMLECGEVKDSVDFRPR